MKLKHFARRRYLIPAAIVFLAGAALAAKPDTPEAPPASASDSPSDFFTLHFEDLPAEGEKIVFTAVCISRAEAEQTLRLAKYHTKYAVGKSHPKSRIHTVNHWIGSGQYAHIVTTRECKSIIEKDRQDRLGDESRDLNATLLITSSEAAERLRVEEEAGGAALVICRQETDIDFDGLDRSLADKACQIFRQSRIDCMKDARSHGFPEREKDHLKAMCHCAGTNSAERLIRNATHSVLRQGDNYKSALRECGYTDWLVEKSRALD